MAEDNNKRRLSQVYDPLSRLGELTRSSHSTPSSPRLLPRRARDASSVVPPPLVAFDVLESGHSGGSHSDPSAINWQERCLELQLELHRSRTQATRTRDMLREKILEMSTLKDINMCDKPENEENDNLNPETEVTEEPILSRSERNITELPPRNNIGPDGKEQKEFE